MSLWLTLVIGWASFQAPSGSKFRLVKGETLEDLQVILGFKEKVQEEA